MNRRAFTLVELLLAAALSSILMAGLIVVLSGVSRDARRLRLDREQIRSAPLTELLRRDFTNSTAITPLPRNEGFTLAGNLALDPETGVPNGRLARVTYRTNASRSAPCLVREQTYLDDPLNPRPWTGLVSVGVTRIVVPISQRPREAMLNEEEAPEVPSVRSHPVPARPTIRVEYADGAIDLSFTLR